MEPTPELKELAERMVVTGPEKYEPDTIGAHVQWMMENAKELRAVLEPFERAAEFPPHVKEAVEHARMMRESTRAADEAKLNNMLAGKPMPVFREPRDRTAWLNLVAAGLAGVPGGVATAHAVGGTVGLLLGGLVSAGFAAGVTWLVRRAR